MTTLVMRNFMNVLTETEAMLSKQDANYIDYSMSGEKCRNCQHFIPLSRCEIVEGKINPNGWCKYFKE